MAKTKKLTLRSETVRKLTGIELGDIYGGTGPAVMVPLIGASIRLCTPAAVAVPKVIQASPKIAETAQMFVPKTGYDCDRFTMIT